MTAPDVVVVGGGPSGAATATRLARRGWEVTLVERDTYPREKPCGDGLTPRALAELADLGVDLATRFHPVKGIRVRARGRMAEVAWPDLDGETLGGLVAPRLDLDTLLADVARAAGARVVEGTEARPLPDPVGRLRVGLRSRSGEAVSSPRIVVVADGWPSRFARGLGVQPPPRSSVGLAVRGYYASGRSLDPYLEFHLDIGENDTVPGYGWVFPVGNGTVNAGVAALTSSPRRRGLAVRHVVEGFVAGLGEEWALSPQPVDGLRAGGLPMGLVEPSVGKDWLLVGDAVGVVNPFTGEGISYALESARLAASVIDVVLSTDDPTRLADYAASLRRRYRAYQRWASRFLTISGPPQVRRALASIALGSPGLLSRATRKALGPGTPTRWNP